MLLISVDAAVEEVVHKVLILIFSDLILIQCRKKGVICRLHINVNFALQMYAQLWNLTL